MVFSGESFTGVFGYFSTDLSQLYNNTFNNSDEMDKSLGRQNYQSFIWEGIGNENGTMSVQQMEFMIENLPTKETPDADGFTGEF